MRAWLVVVAAISVITPLAFIIGEPASSTTQQTPSSKVERSNRAPASSSIDATAQAAIRAAIREKSTGPRAVIPRVPHLDTRLQAIAARSRAMSMKVTIAGSPTQIVSAVHKLGGKVDAMTAQAVSAIVPRTSLSTLASSPGVSQVNQPDNAFVQGSLCGGSGCTGISDSNAATWQAGGTTGAGVTIGIIDGGFLGLAAAETSGDLPADGSGLIYETFNGSPTENDRCTNDAQTSHGTAVAEIIHQMAPDATLVLECVDNNVDFQNAGMDMENVYHAQIVSSSLAFPTDSRGDGTGDSTSAATTVEDARRAGILWIESAGNNGVDHWAGNFTAPDKNLLVNLDPHHLASKAADTDQDTVGVDPLSTAEIVLQWDQWPISSADVTLIAVGSQGSNCNGSGCATWTPIPNTPDCGAVQPQYCISQVAGTSPTIAIDIVNNTSSEQAWTVGIEVGAGTPTSHYDLSYWGGVTADALDCGVAGPNSTTCYSPVTAAGSITQPASSPYVLAVGAADGGGPPSDCSEDLPASASPGDPGTYPLEAFSSQGPTIDGRIKPDILGFDNTYITAWGDRFCGTSAAAPHVAGAAALALSANPDLDASQLEAFLEQRASGNGAGQPANPATNQSGHGVLDLGAVPPITTPTPSTYTPLATPIRAIDTRKTSGPLAGGKTLTVTIPPTVGLPGNATAVAINLAAVNAGAGPYLSAYPAGAAYPGTSNLNMNKGDVTAAVFAVVTLGTNQRITVRNGGLTATGVLVDVVGYFSPSASGLKYSSGPGIRLLDTRNTTGLLSPLNPITVHTPLTGGAAVVNVTATKETDTGWLHLQSGNPVGQPTTSTLNYVKNTTRANLAVVNVDSSGNFTITDGGRGSTDVVVDLVGSFTSGGLSSYVALPSPVRIVDTRTGNGGLHSALGSSTTMTIYAAGVGEIPRAAAALLTGVIEVPAPTVPATGDFFTVYATGTPRPVTSTLNSNGGRIVPNATIANLNPGVYAFNIYNDQATANAVVDVFGYFI